MPDSTTMFNPTLLPSSVFIDVEDGSSSKWDISISSGGFLDGEYAGWCIDWYPAESDGMANVYSSFGEPLPDNITSRINEEYLDSVNWILNQNWSTLASPEGNSFDADEIQRAIWTLIDAGNDVYSQLYPSPSADVSYIVQRASGEGDGFIPQGGDTFAVILEPQGGAQVVIVPVNVPLTPSIDIEKYIKFPKTNADPMDADTPEDGPNVLKGYDPLFDFVITNDGEVDLYNLTVTDNVFNLDGLEGDTVLGDGAYTFGFLASGQTKTITLGGFWQEGQHTNTATVTTDYRNNWGQVTTVADSDDANYFGAVPSVDIEKSVSVDGGTEWFDSDTTENQPVSLLQNEIAPQFKFVVNNTGNVDLTNVIISDDIFELDGFADDPIFGDGGYTINLLSAGDSFTLPVYTDQWHPNQHTNIANATGSFTDDLGHTATPTDNDAANYDGQAIPEVSDKALCGIYVTKNSPDTQLSLWNAIDDADDVDSQLDFEIIGNTNEALFSDISIDPITGILLLDYNKQGSNIGKGKDGSATSEITIRATDPNGLFVDYEFFVYVAKNNAAFPDGTDCNEYFHGGNGKDPIKGMGGDDILIGSNGKDYLLGGDGNDILYGGDNEKLNSKEKDILNGGEGNDIFVLSPYKDGRLTIEDFEDGKDIIGLLDGSFNQLSIRQSGSDVTIYSGRNLLATVLGAEANQFSQSDFQTVTNEIFIA